MNPDLRLGPDRGREPAEKTCVLAVDEDIDMAAKLTLFIEYSVAEARKPSRDHVNYFCRSHHAGRRYLQVNDVAAATPFAQCRRNMNAHFNRLRRS